MVSIKVPEKFHEKKLDRFLKEQFENLPYNAIRKAIRTKDIRINGSKISENMILKAGDRIDVYIKDDILYGIPAQDKSAELEIVFEDCNILVINKKPGIPVHPDKDLREVSLIDMAAKYLINKGEYNPQDRESFPPALCHRLDRNTGGIVIIAKTSDALCVLLEKFKKHEMKKFYQCLVIGHPKPEQARLKHFLAKDEAKSLVSISDKRKPGAVEIITCYKVLEKFDETSLLEVELVTGKTHQIRAHLAYIGHPIVGDGKYGDNRFNRKAGAKYQSLWAYKVVLDFKEAGILNYLRGKVIEAKNIELNISYPGMKTNLFQTGFPLRTQDSSLRKKS